MLMTEGQANLPLRMAAKHALYSVFFYCFNCKHNIALFRNSDSYIAFGRQCTFIYEAIFFFTNSIMRGTKCSVVYI